MCDAKEGEEQRNLRIKTGAVKRTTKEFLYYFKEKAKEEEFLQKMRTINADEYDIKQQENVVQESHMMIPETKKGLEGLLADLKQYKDEVAGVVPEDSKGMVEAMEVIAAADASLKE